MALSTHVPATAPRVQVRSAVPTFLVDDVARTAAWYVEQLGFTIAGHVPAEAPYVYASLQRGGAELMLLNLAGYEKPDLRRLRPAGLWDAYMRTDGVRAMYGAIRDQSIIATPLGQRPYGDWEFEVRDPNGYVLVFGGGADVEGRDAV